MDWLDCGNVPLEIDWSVCCMTGWMRNNSIVNGLASQAIVPIIDGLARPVWNPFLTSWPAVRCNPKFGLYYLYIIYSPFFEEISNMITAKTVKCYIKNGVEFGGMGSMFLSNFDDLYLIRCKMSYKLHI